MSTHFVLRTTCPQTYFSLNNGYSQHLDNLGKLFDDQDRIVPDDQDMVVPDVQGQAIDYVGPWMAQPENIQNFVNPNLMNMSVESGYGEADTEYNRVNTAFLRRIGMFMTFLDCNVKIWREQFDLF